MSGEVLVKVEGVSKKFCRSLKRSLVYGLQDIGTDILGRNGRHDELRKGEFWAVSDVSFELRRGECLGLIGRNGAGKTTLLKMLNGLIKPDGGRIEVHGSMGAVIALGAGFNPILTGRENIYVSGSLRGMTKKEIDKKMEEIVDFAELQDFIDSPVQSYSSGMQVRLGFAVASSLSPDIMLIDEVLAVGDTAFRFKCMRRIGELRRTAAMILVSHNMQQIGLACNRAIVLSKGCKVSDGTVQDAAEVYQNLNEPVTSSENSFQKVTLPLTAATLKFPVNISSGDAFRAELIIDSAENLEGFYVLIKIYGPDEVIATEISNYREPVNIARGENHLHILSERLFLKPGDYLTDTTLYLIGSPVRLAHFWRINRLHIDGKSMWREAYHQLPATLSQSRDDRESV